MCTDKRGVRLEFKLQHNETWSAAAWPPIARVIAQQYSSATTASLRLGPHQKRNAALFENAIVLIYFLLLKIRKLSNGIGHKLNLFWIEDCLYLWGTTVGAWSWQFLCVSLRDCMLLRTLLRCFLFFLPWTTELHSGTQVMLTWWNDRNVTFLCSLHSLSLCLSLTSRSRGLYPTCVFWRSRP